MTIKYAIDPKDNAGAVVDDENADMFIVYDVSDREDPIVLFVAKSRIGAEAFVGRQIVYGGAA